MPSLFGTRCIWPKLLNNSNGKAIPYKKAISRISGQPVMHISMSMAGITLTSRRLRDGRDYVLCGSRGRLRKRTKFRHYYRKAFTGFFLVLRSKNTKCQSTLTFVRRGGPLRATTAELLRVKRHKFPDAPRRPAGHPLHAVRQPVILTRPVQLAHRHQMPGQVLRQPRPFQLLFPILGRDVSVRDLTVQRVREFPGDGVHVLRPRTGEFVYPAQVRPGVGEDGSDDPSDIHRGNRRGLAPPERQLGAASVADDRTGEGEEEALQEDRRPDGDDRQAGPGGRLLAEPGL